MTAPRRLVLRIKDDLSWQVLAPVARLLTNTPGLSVCLTDEPYTRSLPFAFIDDADSELWEELYVARDSEAVRTADIVLSCHPAPRSEHPDAVLAAVHHGSGFGESAYALRVVQSSDVYFTAHPREADYIAHYLRGNLEGRQLVPAGQPRVDALLDMKMAAAADLGAARNALGLPEDKGVVLVTSHWTPMSLLRRFGGATVEALQPLGDTHTLLQTAHPVLWRSPDYDTFNPRNPNWQQNTAFDANALKAELSGLADRTPALVFQPTPAISPLLAVADVVIGDYSSVLIEAALIDTPALFTDLPERFMERFRHDLYVQAFADFKGPDDVLEITRKELQNPGQRRDGRQKLAETLCTPPGKAARTVAETLVNLDINALKQARGN